MNRVCLMKLETHSEVQRGDLTTIEDIPFVPKRVFFIYNAPINCQRGGHAHKTCHQLFVAVCGTVIITMGDGRKFILNNPNEGLYVPPKNIVYMEFITENTTLLVIASKKYDPQDYIFGDCHGTD